MHRALVALVLVATLLAVPRRAVAERPPPANHAGASVMGLAGFLRVNAGSYAFFYERVIGGHHGVRIAGDFIHVHHAADHVQSHQWTYGGAVGYRYHRRAGGGPFAGIEAGYRRGFGHLGLPDDPAHTRLRHRQLRVLPEVGVRALHGRLPLSLVTRLAVGYGPYQVTATGRDDEVGAAAARFSRDVLAPLPVVLELELSIAWSF